VLHSQFSLSRNPSRITSCAVLENVHASFLQGSEFVACHHHWNVS